MGRHRKPKYKAVCAECGWSGKRAVKFKPCPSCGKTAVQWSDGPVPPRYPPKGQPAMTTADDGVTWMTGTRQPTPEEAEIARLQSELSALRTRAETAEADVARQMAIANEAVNARIAAERERDALMAEPTEADVRVGVDAWQAERNLYAASFASDKSEASRVYKDDILNPVFSGPASDCREYVNTQAIKAALLAALAARTQGEG